MAMKSLYPAAPLVDQSNYPTAAWQGFFLALWNRTGGGQGTSTADMQAALTQEAAARTAGDVALSGAISAENTARITADNAEAAARAAADAQLQGQISAIPASAGMRVAWWFWR